MTSMWVLRTLARRWVGGQAAREKPSRRRPRRHRALSPSVRLAVESLEDRTLLSVLPAPITTAHLDISHAGGFTPGDHPDNENTPAIAVDPVTPQDLVAVYTRQDTTVGTPYSEIDIAYSTDGGQSWSPASSADIVPGDLTIPNSSSTNFTLPDPTDFSNPQKSYHFATDPSVAFDRAHNFYVSCLETQGADLAGAKASGAIVVQRFDFSSGAPSAGNTSVVYQWAGQDPGLNPRIAVDSNLPSYKDPVTGATVTDPFANPTTSPTTGVASNPNKDEVYVTWNTNYEAPASIPNPSLFNPNTIKIAASSDGGNTFSTEVFVNDNATSGSASSERDTLPTLAVAQGVSSDHAGATSITGGQLTVAWNNFGTSANSIVTNSVSDGGSGFVINGSTSSVENGNSQITDAGPTPSGGSANVPMTTTFLLNMGSVPSNFTISDMDVSLALVHPHLNQLSITLIAPNGDTFNLVKNATDAKGNAITPAQGVADSANLGVIAGGNPVKYHELDTVFDSEAPRNIHGDGGAAPFTAHFKPESGDLSVLDGTTLASLASDNATGVGAGVWQLQITDFRNDGTNPPPTQFLQHWSLDFTQHLTTNGDNTAATGVKIPDSANSPLGAPMAPFPLTVPSDPNRGISPAPSLAVDNTLGSFSPYQGRLYIAYTGASSYVPPGQTKPLHADTNIYLVTSDNGGRSWSSPVQVNDDNPGDDFSEGDRTQFEPSVAVDPVTGTVAVSFYDARNDPANARVATYLATSIDGGNTFAPETYLNSPQQALDASQFNGNPSTSGNLAVTLGPIPDNQSTTNTNADTTFSFGDRQGLAVYGGHVYAVWSGNENAGQRLTSLDGSGTLFQTNRLDILSSVTVIAAGPRVFGQTDGGPVTAQGATALNGTFIPYNGGTTADGTQVPNGFVVTFDRPVDISSFTPSLVQVVYRSPGTAANGNAPYFGGTLLNPALYTVTPLQDGSGGTYGPDKVGVYNGRDFLDTRFLVTFGLQDSSGNPIADPVGTYSYAVGDFSGTGNTIHDDIRQPGTTVVVGAPINPPAPAPAGLPANIPPDSASGDTGGPSSPHTVSTITVSGHPGVQVTHVAVALHIQHTSDSDLVIKLMHNGITVLLSGHEGASPSGNPNQDFGSDFSYTIFDDTAPTPIAAGFAPYEGRFQPDSPLSALNGSPVDGTWTLDIADTVNSNTGQLLDWSLTPGSGFNPPYTSGEIDGGTPQSSASPGNNMDQNGNAVTDQRVTFRSGGDVYADPAPLRNGAPFDLPYDSTTLPLIVPGPHIVSTSVPGQAPSADNLILNSNSPASAIDVVFDRNMDMTTFTTAQLLRLQGPVGTIPLFDSLGNPLPGVGIIPDPNGTDPDPAHPRTFRVTLPSNEYLQTDGTISSNVTNWNILSINGTYTLTLGTGIKSAAGDAVDNNENAGLAVLNGVDPASAGLVPGGVFHSSSTAVTIGPGKSAMGTITFPENFQIQHTQLLLNISTPNASDLEGYLIAPNGTTVIKLFTNPGGQPVAGKQTGFVNTVLDDLASTPIQPNASSAGPSQPLTGTFNPQQPLSTLNGTSSGGAWTLLLLNDSNTDTATLTNWKLTFDETQLGTGLGEPVADQSNVSFRMFNMQPNSQTALGTWTPVGPASIGGSNSGRIGGIAVDPSDPSGNTVYVAGASGGVWKTTNFLTTSGGPTWIPLTDFGPTFGIDIGGIAVFGRNSDPRQSIIYVATGEGDTGSRGVGVLRSLDGGAHWDLLDSIDNVYNAGNDGGNSSLDGTLLPLSARKHELVGSTAFKIIVDPVLNPSTGLPVVYMALSGNNGGVYRSIDGGNDWQNVLPGQATDVALAPYSAFDVNNPAAPPGNAQLIFAALTGNKEGVYKSATEGAFGTWSQMLGTQGGNPLIRLANGKSVGSANVTNSPSLVGNGRIALSVPALTGTLVPGKPYTGGNRVLDLIQEQWVYAVENTSGGGLFGLFLTKDAGNNWTQVHFPYSGNEFKDASGNAGQIPGTPTNNDLKADYGPFGGFPFATDANTGQGNYDVSLQVDPNNANVVYLGGTFDGPPWPLSRIDTTGISDSYALVAYDHSDNDNGATALLSTGRAMPAAAKLDGADFPSFNGLPYLNLLRDPTDPFVSNSTLIVSGVPDKSTANAFTNEGSDIATWGPFDGADGTDHHRVVALRDPLTGKTRLIFGDDQTISTSVDDGSGNVLFSLNNGEVTLPDIDRTGNLQITQMYYGATQPSDAAVQIAGALFYANAQDDGFPVSDGNLLNDGNITWNGPEGDGAGIATDQTGSGALYTYRWPCCGGGSPIPTDFFQVSSPSTGFGLVSRTNGLILTNNGGTTPDPEWPFRGGSNFAVNPSNGDDILMSSQSGNIFRTGDQGNDWVLVGGPSQNPPTLDGTYSAGVAFGPIDPNDGSGRPDLDNLYVGSSGGNLYVTVDGGGHWVDMGAAAGVPLAGSVNSVNPNPRPGTHEAYVVATRGVYHLTYGVTYTAGVPSIDPTTVKLTPITNNLFSLTHADFGNSALYTEPFLVDPAGGQGALTSVVADWRYAIPDDPTKPLGPTHPVVYVGGEGGIFRSEDGGKNWLPYPDAIPKNQTGPDGSRGDGAPVDGGLFAIAHVSNLQLVAGDVNPTTGLPDQSQGPNLLVASTYGRGDWAIRLPLVQAYDVEPTLHVVSAVPTNAATGNNFGNGVTPLPNPVNPSVGLDKITVTFNGTVDPTTFPSSAITLTGPNGPISFFGPFDVTVPGATGGNPHNVWEIDFPHQSEIGTYTLHIDPTLQDLAGRFMDQDLDDTLPQLDSNDTPGTPDVGDGFTGTFLIQGLQVVAATPPSGTLDTPPGLGSSTNPIVITFNAPVDAASFTKSKVTVTGPTGPGHPNDPIPVQGIKDVTPIGAPEPHSIWEIDLPGVQKYPGTYTITVGPNILDTGDGTGSGNALERPMDQDEDSTSPPAATAEPAGSADDAFKLTYTIPSLYVTAVTPDPTLPVLVPGQQAGATGLRTFTLTFSRDVDPTTLTAANLTLHGPATDTSAGPAVAIPAGAISYSTPAGGPANSLVTINLPSAVITPGVYTLTVGMGVTDLNGVPLDQDVDPNTDAPGSGDDAFSVQYSVVGLQVVSVTPAAPPPPTFAGQTSITVTFNQAVLAGTVDGNVVVLDPKGNPVALGTAVDLNPGTDTQWKVPFNTPQTTYGTYTVTVGPGVEDMAGHEMNQDNNNSFGDPGNAPSGDAYQATFSVAGLQVLAVTPYQAATQPIEPASLQTFTVTFNQTVNPASITAADGSGNAVNLTLTGPETLTEPGDVIGPGAVIPIPVSGITDITPAGQTPGTVWQIRLPKAITTAGIYTLTVGTGVEDLGDNPLDQNQDHYAVASPDAGDPDALDSYVAQFDVDGLAVLSTKQLGGTPDPSAPSGSPLQMLPGTVSGIQVVFNQPVLPSSLTSANVTVTDPKGSPVALTGFVEDAGDSTGKTWDVQFAGATVAGVYKITVGPGVEDLAGNKMNQDHNTKYGEPGNQTTSPPGDAYLNSNIFAVAGLRVIGVTPAVAATQPVLEPPGLRTFTVTFNREVLASSIEAPDGSGVNAANLALVGPETPANLGPTIPIPVSGISDVTQPGAPYPNSVWQIQLPAALVTPGIYTLTVGPSITDQSPTAMDQNGNLKFGEKGIAPAGDAFRAQFDVDGLAVDLSAGGVTVQGTPDPIAPSQLLPGVTTATVAFNQPVLASSISVNSFTLIDPNSNVVGLASVAPVAGDTTGKLWQVTFPGQKVPGVYHLTVLHGIKDLAGNQMNQNHNLKYGESGNQFATPVGDDYTTTFAIAGLKVVSITPTLAAPVLEPPGLGAASPPARQADVITITFNRETDPTSFTAKDTNNDAVNLLLEGPATPAGPGAVIPIPVAGLVDATPAGAYAHSVWQVTLAAPLTTPGIYTLTVGPAVTDSTGTKMDENGNFTFGQAGDQNATPPGDQFTGRFDVDGLKVTSLAVSGTPDQAFPAQLLPGVSQATLTFNQPVLASSFSGADVVLTDPTGHTLTATSVAPVTGDTTGTQWQVTFAGQTIPGVYGLTVLHNVEDLAGNPMNQNKDLVFGQAGAAPAGDDYVNSAAFTVVGLHVTSVTPTLATPVLEPPGLGAAASTPGATPIVVTFNREVGSFQPGDVLLTAPDGTTVPSSAITVTNEAVGSGDNVWEVDVNPPLVTPGIYKITLGPNISDGDPTHAKMDQNGNLVFGQAGDQNAKPAPGDQFSAQFDVDGLAVAGVTFPGAASDPIAPAQLLPGVTSAVITFNQAVLPASITNVDPKKGPVNVTLTDPTGKAVPLLSIAPVSGDTTQTQWQVKFAGQKTPGVYKLSVLPGVEDLAGNKMNQNHNGTFGEAGDQFATPAGDGFTAGFAVAGLKVVSVSPSSAQEPPGLSSVTITFNRDVDPKTFSTADLVLTRPDGSTVSGLALKDLAPTTDHHVWEVDFATAETETGTYSLTIGPAIADLTGHNMDQNGNFKFGEPGDAVTASLTVTSPASQQAAALNNPLSGPVDVTGLVTILTTPPVRHGHHFIQQITVFNNSGFPIQGPFSLILLGLPKHVRLLNPSGFSLLRAPHSPFQLLFFPNSVLDSFGGGTFTLVFSATSVKQIRYVPLLLVGFGIV